MGRNGRKKEKMEKLNVNMCKIHCLEFSKNKIKIQGKDYFRVILIFEVYNILYDFFNNINIFMNARVYQMFICYHVHADISSTHI